MKEIVEIIKGLKDEALADMRKMQAMDADVHAGKASIEEGERLLDALWERQRDRERRFNELKARPDWVEPEPMN